MGGCRNSREVCDCRRCVFSGSSRWVQAHDPIDRRHPQRFVDQNVRTARELHEVVGTVVSREIIDQCEPTVSPCQGRAPGSSSESAEFRFDTGRTPPSRARGVLTMCPSTGTVLSLSSSPSSDPSGREQCPGLGFADACLMGQPQPRSPSGCAVSPRIRSTNPPRTE
jgi:hypothetical protein